MASTTVEDGPPQTVTDTDEMRPRQYISFRTFLCLRCLRLKTRPLSLVTIDHLESLGLVTKDHIPGLKKLFQIQDPGISESESKPEAETKPESESGPDTLGEGAASNSKIKKATESPNEQANDTQHEDKSAPPEDALRDLFKIIGLMSNPEQQPVDADLGVFQDAWTAFCELIRDNPELGVKPAPGPNAGAEDPGPEKSDEKPDPSTGDIEGNAWNVSDLQDSIPAVDDGAAEPGASNSATKASKDDHEGEEEDEEESDEGYDDALPPTRTKTEALLINLLAGLVQGLYKLLLSDVEEYDVGTTTDHLRFIWGGNPGLPFKSCAYADGMLAFRGPRGPVAMAALSVDETERSNTKVWIQESFLLICLEYMLGDHRIPSEADIETGSPVFPEPGKEDGAFMEVFDYGPVQLRNEADLRMFFFTMALLLARQMDEYPEKYRTLEPLVGVEAFGEIPWYFFLNSHLH